VRLCLQVLNSNVHVCPKWDNRTFLNVVNITDVVIISILILSFINIFSCLSQHWIVICYTCRLNWPLSLPRPQIRTGTSFQYSYISLERSIFSSILAIYLEESLLDSCSSGQVIPQIWQNPKVQYIVHNSLPVDAILSELSPTHTPMSHIFKIHFNIILIFTSEYCITTQYFIPELFGMKWRMARI
jgi:hypothetical protein